MAGVAPMIDWERVIKPLYFARMTADEIGKRFGIKPNTVRAAAMRYNWNSELASISPIVTRDKSNSSHEKPIITRDKSTYENSIITRDELTEKPIVTRDESPPKRTNEAAQNFMHNAALLVAEYKNKYINNVARAAGKASDSLAMEVEQAKTLNDQAKAFKTFEPVSRVATSTLGLDKQDATQVNVNMLSVEIGGELTGSNTQTIQDVVDVEPNNTVSEDDFT